MKMMKSTANPILYTVYQASRLRFSLKETDST